MSHLGNEIEKRRVGDLVAERALASWTFLLCSRWGVSFRFSSTAMFECITAATAWTRSSLEPSLLRSMEQPKSEFGMEVSPSQPTALGTTLRAPPPGSSLVPLVPVSAPQNLQLGHLFRRCLLVLFLLCLLRCYFLQHCSFRSPPLLLLPLRVLDGLLDYCSCGGAAVVQQWWK